MNVLLDTHAFLWFVWGDARFSTIARQRILSGSITVYLSVVSLWEITIKSSLGKLALNASLADFFARNVDGNGFVVLPIQRSHLLTVHSLPLHHRDPFDRLIAAQAMTEDLELVSGDSALQA